MDRTPARFQTEALPAPATFIARANAPSASSAVVSSRTATSAGCDGALSRAASRASHSAISAATTPGRRRSARFVVEPAFGLADGAARRPAGLNGCRPFASARTPGRAAGTLRQGRSRRRRSRHERRPAFREHLGEAGGRRHGPWLQGVQVCPRSLILPVAPRWSAAEDGSSLSRRREGARPSSGWTRPVSRRGGERSIEGRITPRHRPDPVVADAGRARALAGP